MSVIVVTGSAGLIGSESVKYFHLKGYDIVGIDNDMRSYFFGKNASTKWVSDHFQKQLKNYRHFEIDIRSLEEINNLFENYGSDISCVIHTAAQPSHDWAAKEPNIDFTINANGTLNLLEATRKYCPDAVFIFTSTNKVYGDTPNRLPLIELDKRWEIHESHPFTEGIDESMSIDNSKHSPFGVSKLAADLLVQEYGKYFGMKTVCFRGGCLTGPAHSGVELHGFLAYLVLCAITGQAYTIFGYKGKQVRDNIHSFDLVKAFWEFYKDPRCGEVYNIGGSQYANISVLEAIDMIKELKGYSVNYSISDKARIGDHVWYISNVEKFKSHYNNWQLTYDIMNTLIEIIDAIEIRLKK